VADLDLHGEPAALLVIDLQNAFCHAGGSLARLGRDIAMCRQAIGPCARLVAAARRSGVPVIFTQYVYRADYADADLLLREMRPALRAAGALAEGSWDAAQVDELPPAPGDYVIRKNRYSAFYGTDLEPLLQRLGVRNLILCGVTTNMCVESTARDAMQRDYRVFVAADATGELEPERHDHALRAIAFGFGQVVTLDAVLRALPPPAVRDGGCLC